MSCPGSNYIQPLDLDRWPSEGGNVATLCRLVLRKREPTGGFNPRGELPEPALKLLSGETRHSRLLEGKSVGVQIHLLVNAAPQGLE